MANTATKSNFLSRLKAALPKRPDMAPAEEEVTMKPIAIEVETYDRYPRDKRYDDLMSYMKRHPRMEVLVFEYFYLRLKPLVDHDIL